MALIDNIVWYRNFNANANDSTSNANNGSVTWATNTTGKINNWYSFDWNDYITLSTPSVLNFWTWNFTLNCWINPNMSSWNGIIFRKDYESWSPRRLYSIMFRPDTSRKIQCQLYDSWTEKIVNSTSSLSNWTRYMVTMVRDSTYLNVYINWTYEAQVAHGWINISSNRNAVWWKLTEYNEDYYTWLIDEFGAWSRALSWTEISELYNWWAWLTYPFTTSFIPPVSIF